MEASAKKEIFIDLIKNNKGILYKIIISYCKDSEDRRDLEQEILIQLWRSLPFYNEQYKFSTWLYRIALNVAISFYRKDIKRKNSSISLNKSIFEIPEDDGHTEIQDTRTTLLYTFINNLDNLNKAIIILYLEENSYKEIAEIMGISETNVGSKLNRIKNKLKTSFSIVNL